jgi:putative spermidine/putrescine transport system substrate-binding protein
MKDDTVERPRSGFDRRAFGKLILGAAGTVASPAILNCPVRAAERIVVAQPGGPYEVAFTKAFAEPFTKATGIEVVKVPATMGKLLAMVESGNIELDVIDVGELGALQLSAKGALEPLDYKSWKHTDVADIDKDVVRKDMVANIYFSTVLGYNTQVFPTGKHPRTWADFWDAQKFPGPRMLTDLAAGAIDLEFALIADGVPMDKLYPIDLDRGFKSLSRVRPHIRKFWDTGALSAQMLADREVVMGSLWNGRLQAVADKGAPLAIEWNQAMLQVQYWGVFKGAKNREAAHRLIDFAMQPKNQAELAKHIPYGPTNKKAFDHIGADLGKRLPSFPEHKARQFVQNAQWWADNRNAVSERWSKWLLQKS